MWVEQRELSESGDWVDHRVHARGREATLALVFGAPRRLDAPDWFDGVRAAYPAARIVSASTAGEIHDVQVREDSLQVTAMGFERARCAVASVDLERVGHSRLAGLSLARALNPGGLRHVLVFSDGHRINGSELAQGLSDGLPPGVASSGGLAGDGDRFRRTLVGLDGPAAEGRIVAVGLYGANLRIGFGSLGGWDPFGPERIVTRASGNVLYELDGRNALALYREYLGPHAVGLPATALLFPLRVQPVAGGPHVVRTILDIDETEEALIFAGDVPVGARAQLMRASVNRLVEGAQGAAQSSLTEGPPPDLALLVSCVGRKLVLKQRVEEELEAVREVFGPDTALTGFYSYGELGPSGSFTDCALHNQTMTITTLGEA